MFDACAAQPACNTAFPNLRDELTTTVNRLTRQPLTAAVPDPTTGQSTDVVFDGYAMANLLAVPRSIPLGPPGGRP